MPRNSQGVYTLPAGNPVVTDTIISSTWANPTMADLGNEIGNSLDRSGRGGMLGALYLQDGTFGAPGLSFTSESTLGLYRSAPGVLRAQSGGIFTSLSNYGFGVNTDAGFGCILDVVGTIRGLGGEVSPAGYGLRLLNSTAQSGGSLKCPPGLSMGMVIDADSGPLQFTSPAMFTQAVTVNGTMTPPTGISLYVEGAIQLVNPPSSAYGFRMVNSTFQSGGEFIVPDGIGQGVIFSTDAGPLVVKAGGVDVLSIASNLISAAAPFQVVSAAGQPAGMEIRRGDVTNQTSLTFSTNSTGQAFQLYQQVNATDLRVFNSIYGGDIISWASDGFTRVSRSLVQSLTDIEALPALSNYQCIMTYVNDGEVKVSLQGSDGVVRSVNLSLS